MQIEIIEGFQTPPPPPTASDGLATWPHRLYILYVITPKICFNLYLVFKRCSRLLAHLTFHICYSLTVLFQNESIIVIFSRITNFDHGKLNQYKSSVTSPTEHSSPENFCRTGDMAFTTYLRRVDLTEEGNRKNRTAKWFSWRKFSLDWGWIYLFISRNVFPLWGRFCKV